MFVVVTGPPAAGKSTVSALLAQELGLPRLAEDTLKRGLLEVLRAGDLDATRRLGAAAVRALLGLAADNRAAVLDSVWVCACELPELRRRYRRRAEQRAGRPYDFDLERSESELWNDRSMRPLAGGWPVLTVDTTVEVDVAALAEAVRRAGGAAPA